MESIRKEQQSTINEEEAEKNIIKEFFGKMGDLSQMQKIKLIYTYFTNKKPDPLLNDDKVLNRILYEIEYGQKIKETKNELEKQKKFKWPWKARSEMKNSKKKRDMVLIFYINIKSELESPRLYPVYGGNMIIIRNKPYLFDPRAVLSFGKYKCLVIREIDRKPVCNLDYAEVKKRGDSTESDELLIKATLKAMLGAQKKEVNKTMIIIGVIVLLCVGGYFLMKG